MSEPTWFDDEPDPTGVRALLSAQPDPGPMPKVVSDRILAALAENGRRAGLDEAAGSAELGAELGLSGVSGAAGSRRRRGTERPESLVSMPRVDTRRRWAVLGSAAATLVALGLAGGLLSQTGSRGAASASLPGAVAGAAARQDSSQGSTARSGAPELNVASSATPTLHIEMSTRTYTRQNVARLAQDLVDAPTAELRQPAGDSPSVAPIGTPLGLAECVTTLGEDGADAVYADLAMFEGTPGVVLVVIDANLKEVYVVERTCAKGAPGVLFGPVQMP